MIYVISAIVCAVAFRLRGDAIVARVMGMVSATWAGRLLWSLIGTIVLFKSAHHPAMLAAVPLLFIGCVPGWYDGIKFGAGDPDAVLHGFILIVRGVVWLAPAVPLVWWANGPVHALALALAGPACAIAYGVASLITVQVRIGELYLSSHDGKVNVPLGECLFGASMGAILTMGGVA
jgi:hypothetical protein